MLVEFSCAVMLDIIAVCFDSQLTNISITCIEMLLLIASICINISDVLGRAASARSLISLLNALDCAAIVVFMASICIKILDIILSFEAGSWMTSSLSTSS